MSNKKKAEEIDSIYMSKDQFVDEIGLESDDNELKVDIDYLYSEFIKKVEPNLELINHWRFEEKMNYSDVKNALGLTNEIWKQLKRMPTLKMYLEHGGSFLQAKLQRDFLQALKEHKGNAKFWDMAFKRFDKGYSDKRESTLELPEKIEFSVVQGSLDDEQIQNKTGTLENTTDKEE